MAMNEEATKALVQLAHDFHQFTLQMLAVVIWLCLIAVTIALKK